MSPIFAAIGRHLVRRLVRVETTRVRAVGDRVELRIETPIRTIKCELYPPQAGQLGRQLTIAAAHAAGETGDA